MKIQQRHSRSSPDLAPTQKPLAGAQPLPADDVPSSALPLALAVEAQVAAQTTFERAREFEVKGQWEEAKSYYRQALTLNPTLVEARNNLGELYVRQQQLTAAIDEFRAAIRSTLTTPWCAIILVAPTS